MATYNLAAGDLITLLNSTVTSPTANAILSTLLIADAGVLTGLNGVQTTEGPSDVTDPHFPVNEFDSVGSGISLELITVPTSTTSGSTYVPGAAGTAAQTAITPMNISTAGGVVIGAGDQFVSLIDYNSGGTADTLVGGAYKERLISNTGNNVLMGGTGANTLLGGSGADTLVGGGDSRLVAGLGANVLKSSTLSSGHDTLIGSAGSVQLIAQAGDNRLIGGAGSNTLTGGSGLDTLIGGGNSHIMMTTGNTRVLESISGASDTIVAGAGLDTIKMFFGTTNIGDSIVGSSGSLRILDLAGSNTIQGGSGGDTVILAGAYGPGGSTVSNTANQTITAGSGGVRIVTDESGAASNVNVATAAGGNYTVTFTDTHQSLSIIDTSGSSVTVVFGDGSQALKV
jgi:hypothetical protein